MTDQIRILIADDHPIFREGLVHTIERNAEYAVVGQAADGAAALDLLRKLHPDIAVLDVAMPVMGGIEALRAAHQEGLPTSVVLITMHTEPEYFDAALDLGARGYLLKDSVIDELMRCLSKVSKGEYFISPSISHLLIERKKRNELLWNSQPVMNRITPAERIILSMLSRNLTSKEIAEQLCISVRTVESHRQHMCEKLEIKGHNKLLEFALQHKSEL
jgi:DNA-binding NarL/FixJ family response regulator